MRWLCNAHRDDVKKIRRVYPELTMGMPRGTKVHNTKALLAKGIVSINQEMRNSRPCVGVE